MTRREAIIQALASHECIDTDAGPRDVLSLDEATLLADAVLPLVAEAEQHGYERGKADGIADADVDTHYADAQGYARGRRVVLAEARAAIQAATGFLWHIEGTGNARTAVMHNEDEAKAILLLALDALDADGES